MMAQFSAMCCRMSGVQTSKTVSYEKDDRRICIVSIDNKCM